MLYGKTISAISGSVELSQLLGGGIRYGSLVIVIGEIQTGKSTFSLQLLFDALKSKDNSAVLYTTEYKDTRGVSAQMHSLGMDILRHLRDDRLRVYPLKYTGTPEKNSPEMLNHITNHMLKHDERYNLIVFDSVTPFLLRLKPAAVMDFIFSCKEICQYPRSTILTVHPYGLDEETLHRLFLISDYYLQFSIEDRILPSGMMEERHTYKLGARKLRGCVQPAGNCVKFEIVPFEGIQILPIRSVRV